MQLSQLKLNFLKKYSIILEFIQRLKVNSIGVYGISKGGDIALGIMSRLKDIRSLVVVNGCVSSIGTSTTYKDKIVDMINADISKVEFLPDGAIDIVNTLNDPRDEPSSCHPFEYSSADLLMIAGLDDHNWKSELYVDIAKEKMDAVGKSNYEIVKCPGMGHFLDVPFAPVCSQTGHPMVPQGMKVYFGGKDPKAHSDHQEQVWKKVISFFDKSLKA